MLTLRIVNGGADWYLSRDMEYIKRLYLPGIAANVFPHNVNDGGADEGVFYDERIQIRRRVSNDSAHNWVSAAHCSVIDIGDQRSWIEAVE